MEKIKEILRSMGMDEPENLSAFPHEEGAGEYRVWKVEYPDRNYVLKCAKGNESEIYEQYLKAAPFAPQLAAKGTVNGEDYLLLSHVEGNNLIRCSRDDLMAATKSLIEMQRRYWNTTPNFEALRSRENRRQYLNDALLQQVYDAYLADCRQIPWTLCHDDLLPFNVINSHGIGVFIDWEVGGILPYPASLARLIAHTNENSAAPFYMKRDDIEAAVDFYYEQFLKPMGITRDAFLHSLELHLFYEYCEWVYVGNKFGSKDSDLYCKYAILATNMAKKIIRQNR